MHHRLEQTWEFKKAGKRIDSFDEQYRAAQEAGRSADTSYNEKQANNHNTARPEPQPTRRRCDPEKLARALDKEREAKAAARRGRPYLRGQPQLAHRFGGSTNHRTSYQHQNGQGGGQQNAPGSAWSGPSDPNGYWGNRPWGEGATGAAGQGSNAAGNHAAGNHSHGTRHSGGHGNHAGGGSYNARSSDNHTSKAQSYGTSTSHNNHPRTPPAPHPPRNLSSLKTTPHSAPSHTRPSNHHNSQAGPATEPSGNRFSPAGPVASSRYSHLYEKPRKSSRRGSARLPKPPPIEEFHRAMCKRPKTPKKPPQKPYNPPYKSPQKSPQRQQAQQPCLPQRDSVQSPAGSKSLDSPTRGASRPGREKSRERTPVAERPRARTAAAERHMRETPAIEKSAEPTPPAAPKSPKRRAATPRRVPNQTGSPNVKREEDDNTTDRALLTGATLVPVPPAPNPRRAASESSSHTWSSSVATSGKSSAGTHLTEPSPNLRAGRPALSAACRGVVRQPQPGAAATAAEQPSASWQEHLDSLRWLFVDALNGVAERLEEKNNQLSEVVGRQGKMMEKHHALVLSQLALTESIEADESANVNGNQQGRSRTSAEWRFINGPVEGPSDDSADETYAPTVRTCSVMPPPRGDAGGTAITIDSDSESDSEADPATYTNTMINTMTNADPDSSNPDSSSDSDSASETSEEETSPPPVPRANQPPPQPARPKHKGKRKHAATVDDEDDDATADEEEEEEEDTDATPPPPLPPHVLRVSKVPNPHLAKVRAMLREHPDALTGNKRRKGKSRSKSGSKREGGSESGSTSGSKAKSKSESKSKSKRRRVG